MKIVKKFTAIKISETIVDETSKPDLEFGQICGPHYDRQYPETVFDTEDKAIEFAFNEDEYSNWMIVPIIKFVND